MARRTFFLFLLGLLCGAMLGLILGFVLVPDTGQQLRSHSQQWAKDLLKEGQAASQARRQQLRDDLQAKIKPKAQA